MDETFTLNDRENYGRNVALVMALKKDKPSPNAGKALPDDATNIRKRLQFLSQELTSNTADFVELLVRFDDAEGWKCNGSKHCAAWANFEIGISVQTAWEYLRAGRKLKTLTTLRALFRAGKISWSKVREITRVADETNEALLCHAALDGSVSDIKQLVEEYRWIADNDIDAEIKAENEKAMQQWLARSLTWTEASNGNTRIQITLPSELAQVFLNSVEQSVNQLDTTSTRVSQRRADAAVLMAEKSLQSESRDIATADRYQVVVSVDAAELKKAETSAHAHQNDSDASHAPNTSYAANRSHASNTSHAPNKSHTPQKRSTVQNAGPIAKETARRIACDCSISVIFTENGEPINIGRKSRIWTAPIARVIKDRDQGCVWPGCTQCRHLQIHHIKHWGDDGESSVNNGACLCPYHHTMVHEGGYTIVNTEVDARSDEPSIETLLDTQFFRQLNTADTTQFDFEKNLRHDWESFDSVRNVMPSRFRFRIFNADGVDILDTELDDSNDYIRRECRDGVGEYCVTPVAHKYNGSTYSQKHKKHSPTVDPHGSLMQDYRQGAAIAS